MNILFTCAGRRNYLINYFKEALNGQGKILATDMTRTAPAMNDADIAIEVPSIYDSNYIKSIVNVVKDYNVDAIISLNDLELPVLSANKTTLENAGARVVVSEKRVIDIAFDKWKTFKFATSIGVKTPHTYISYNDAIDAIHKGELKFPLVVKPRWGSGSISIEFPESLEEFDLVYKLLSLKLKRTILNEASKEDIEHALIIQEKIEGVEYGVDILNDFEGNYVGCFARRKLAMRSGETDKAVSVIDLDIAKLAKHISEELRHIGNLDCDFFVKDGEYYLLEINPRFGGGYPFSHEAGVNTAAMYITWLNNERDVQKYINYRKNILSSKCDRLIVITNKE